MAPYPRLVSLSQIKVGRSLTVSAQDACCYDLLESICVKITETACVSDELYRLLKKKKKKKKKMLDKS